MRRYLVVDDNRAFAENLAEILRDEGAEVSVAGSGKEALELARKVGPTPSTVLILGESGTGKELLARAVHRFAQAAKPTDGRFLAVNCAAIPSDLPTTRPRASIACASLLSPPSVPRSCITPSR